MCPDCAWNIAVHRMLGGGLAHRLKNKEGKGAGESQQEDFHSEEEKFGLIGAAPEEDERVGKEEEPVMGGQPQGGKKEDPVGHFLFLSGI